jgi:hypothetical protein
MAEVIHKHSTHVRTTSGHIFRTRVCGERQPDGLWTGWLEFDDETTQPNREALDYWASGLEPVYVEGAFARALPVAVKQTISVKQTI